MASGSPLAVPAMLWRAIPHLQGFFPDHPLVAPGTAGAVPLLPEGHPGAAPPAAALHVSESPWRAPAFGRRHAPVALVVAPGPEPLALALRQGAAGPDAAAQAAVHSVMAQVREARVGGTPGLPDPGPAGLGLPSGEAVLVIDPCAPAQAAAARALLEAARATATGRPLLLAASPAAPPGARPVLPEMGARRLPGRLAPWTLLDLAHALHALEDGLGLLGLAAGLPVQGPAWAGQPAEAVFSALVTATHCADPFRTRPWSLEQAIRQLADWRVAEAANRRIIACTGMEWFKHRRIRAALASTAGPPRILARGSTAIRAAQRAGGAVAVWASVMPPGLPARAAAAGVPLVRMEDGFIRSAGLGVLLAPAASLVMDGRGIHYDPSVESDLEHLLAHTEFSPALLARAARLRQALVAGAVTKYNLAGAAPPLSPPPGRRVILVPGQVEDDAAMRQGGARIRTNLDLLRAVRRENPDAFILYKPHPDVEAGMRAGAVPAAAAATLADQVLARVPIGPLYAMVQEVHCIASLTGFEALLRGLQVVTYGRPFYAGWGLTTDRDPPPRRGRRLELDALVAGALILHPRYIDPVTGLPCPPEVLLDRLATPGPVRHPRTPAALRALIGGASRFLAGWWAAR
jgi:capsular polysaccharide export protein